MLPDGLFADLSPAERRRRRKRTDEATLLEEAAAAEPTSAKSALLADEEPQGEGLFAGTKPAKKAGRSWQDSLGLIGATLIDSGAGFGGQGSAGAIEHFLDREKGKQEEANWEQMLGGLNIDDPFERELARTDKGAYLAARFGDKREQKTHERDRGEGMADETRQRGYNVEDRDLGLAEQRAGRDQQHDEFEATLGQSADQHDDTMGFNYAQLSDQRAAKAAERAAKASGAAVFEGPQLATIYNKNQDYLSEQEAALKDMETAAAESAAFVADARNFNSQGSSVGDNIGRFWSGITGGKVNDLNRHTKAVSAAMKKPGGGAWTDADQKNAEMYVVNAANGPDANKFSANVVQNMANRQRAYVEFLRQSIDPQDPELRQTAQQYWDAYKNEVPLFDQRTKQPLDPSQVPAFEQWLEYKQTGAQPAQPTTGNDMRASGALDLFVQSVKTNPASFQQEVTEFDGTFGPGSARKAFAQKFGETAAKSMFGQ